MTGHAEQAQALLAEVKVYEDPTEDEAPVALTAALVHAVLALNDTLRAFPIYEGIGNSYRTVGGFADMIATKP